MMARIEGRLGSRGGDPYDNEIKLEVLKWVMGEVEKV